jgi:N-acetylneuraminic acid mutarotase
MRRLPSLFVLILATMLGLPANAVAAPSDVAEEEAAAASSSQWTARPSLRHARGGLGVATVDRQILAIGGFDGDNPAHILDVVEGRQVAGSGRWRDLAPMSTPRTNLATAEVAGLVYAIGAAGLDGLLYVAGGFIALGGNNFEITNSVVVYDPTQDTWRSVAPMPTARERLRLVASGGYLYAIGGLAPPSAAGGFGPSLTTVERYDPKSNSWATMNPMVESRGLPCAVETRVGQRRVLVVVGGFEFTADGSFVGARRTTEVFDPATGQWTLLDVLLPSGRGAHDCATEADGTVLAIGGIASVAGVRVFLANVDALSL